MTSSAPKKLQGRPPYTSTKGMIAITSLSQRATNTIHRLEVIAKTVFDNQIHLKEKSRGMLMLRSQLNIYF